VDPILNRFISNLPSPFPVAGGEVRLRGAVVQIDETTGRAVGITRVDEPGLSASVPSDAEPKIDIENAPSSEQT
jgi:calcineurin-like phosphoesterase